MKRLLSIISWIVVLIMGAPLTGSSQIVKERPSILPNGAEMRPVRHLYSVQPKKSKSVAEASSETVYTVNVNVKDCPEKGIYASDWLFAIPRGGRRNEIAESNGDGFDPFMLTAGTYDFIFEFDCNYATYVVVKEGVEVNSDMEISASWEEATNLLECNFLLPDGKEIEPPIYDIDSDTVIKGNIVMGSCGICLFSKNGTLHSLIINGYDAYIYQGELESSISSNPIYVNSNSVLEYGWLNTVLLEDGPIVMSLMTSEDSQPKRLNNESYEYSEINVEYGTALNAEGENGIKGGTLAYTILDQDRIIYGIEDFLVLSASSWDSSRILYQNPTPSTLTVCPTLNKVLVYDPNYDMVFGIKGPVCEPTADPNVFNPFSSLFCNRYSTAGYDYYSENPMMAYSVVAGNKVNIGTTTPGIVMLRDKYGMVSCDFISREGSNRSMDFLAAKVNVKHNGEVVCDNVRGLNLYLYDEYWNPIKSEGSWDYEVESSNIKVDGEVATSKLTLHVEQDDDYCTTLGVPQVQFRNGDGQITNEFINSQEMKLLVEAGRYRHFLEYDDELRGESSWWEGYEAESVEAVISSPSLAERLELPLASISLNDTDGKGEKRIIYTVDGASLDESLPDGWYDLTITVKDGKDYCEQFIERAFKIDSSGNAVDKVRDERVKVVGNSIVVDGEAEIYNIGGIKVNGRNLPTGIYFVVLPEKTLKVMVK